MTFFCLQKLYSWIFSLAQYLGFMNIIWLTLLSYYLEVNTAQKMKFSIEDFFTKCDHTRGKLRVWSNLTKKSLMRNSIFCAVNVIIIDVFLPSSRPSLNLSSSCYWFWYCFGFDLAPTRLKRNSLIMLSFQVIVISACLRWFTCVFMWPRSVWLIKWLRGWQINKGSYIA